MTRLRRVLLVCFLGLATGCGGDPTSWADGTVDKGGKCVPADAVLTCGTGTELVDGVCVAQACEGALVWDGGTCAAPPCANGQRWDGTKCATPTCPSGQQWDGAACVKPCEPACIGKQCGGNGCGGTCGECDNSAKSQCSSAGLCVGGCAPSCADKVCGDDGCGGACGACSKGNTCSVLGQCVPENWFCDSWLYGDGLSCDCGCGAVDPDCKTSGLPLGGCPAGAACDAVGLCTLPTAHPVCDHDGDCGKSGQWCTGLVYADKHKWRGYCGFPLPLGKPTHASCKTHLQCATNACVGEQCARHYAADSHCNTNEACVAGPVLDPTHGGMMGFAAVCAYLGTATKACQSQQDCAADGSTCAVAADPTTLQARYLCRVLGDGVAAGKSCAAHACQDGLLCANDNKGAVCALPCPGGDTDCATGHKCGSMLLHDGGTKDPADDVKAAVCLP